MSSNHWPVELLPPWGGSGVSNMDINFDPAPSTPANRHTNWSLSTRAIHADDPLNSATDTDVAPSMHLATTFRYPSDASLLLPAGQIDRPPPDPLSPSPSNSHIYSRISNPGLTRLEAVLSSLLQVRSLTYSSGLAAFHALLVHLKPRTVAIGQGYHGCHGVLAIYQRLTSCAIVDLSPSSLSKLQKGDLIHLETPVNPTGESFDISSFASAARSSNSWLSVDSTFAPPPLSQPFAHGAHFAIHSGTKYLGGHSDMLLGVLAVAPGLPDTTKSYRALFEDRYLLGATPGSLENWLGTRSLRTLELRVVRQAQSADRLVAWLDADLQARRGVVGLMAQEVRHSSLQGEKWVKEQLPKGGPAVFALLLRTEEAARRLPAKLRLFHHATSLGGVESLIEWRAMSDKTVDKRLLRVSVGVEDVDDLKADLVEALTAVFEELGGDIRSLKAREVHDK